LPAEDWPIRRGLTKGETIVNEDVFHRNSKGIRRVLRTSAVPVRNGAGEITAAVSSYHDVTERRRAVDALVFLSQAGSVLNASLDYEATLSAVAQLVVPGIADWCAVDHPIPGGAVLETGARIGRLEFRFVEHVTRGF